MATPPLGTINGVPSTDTASPLYLPPVGYYQNDAGAVVPISQINSPVAPTAPSSPSTSGGNYTYDFTQNLPGFLQPLANSLLQNRANSAAQSAGLNVGTVSNDSNLESLVTIVVGLILIGAGLFAFKSAQTVIQTGGRVARRAGEIAAS